jgi:hypothetical protein
MKFDLHRAVGTVTFILFFINISLQGQGSTDGAVTGYARLVNQAYGQDQELVNGKQYYNRHPRSMGHPYLLEGWVHQGSVTLRGKVYEDIWLRYDIESQQVEVEYRTMNGGDNQVVLVNDRVDEFSIGEYYFKRIKLEPDLPNVQFYQVLGYGRMVWYIRWNKKIVPVSGDSRFIEEYTQPRRNYLMELDGAVDPFNSRRSFVKLFPREIQKEMRRLIKKNHLQLRSASISELELFIRAATSLLAEGGVQ